jgi:hypothetical protein
MARRGILDYVLGGAVGGLEGLAQQRAAEDEKKRMAAALARQTEQDTLAKGTAMIARVQSGVRPYQPDEQLGEDERLADIPGLGKMVIGQSQADRTAAQRALTAATATQKQQEYNDRGVYETLTRTINPDTRKPFIDPTVPFEQSRGRLQPTFDLAKQMLANTASMDRTTAMARSQSGMGSYMPGLTPEGQPSLFFGTRGGQITPTGVGATTSQAGGKIPPADKKSMVELEASIKELDKALESVNANKNAFGAKTILPNFALSRTQGVKPRADVVGAIVKLRRTEFGTAMSRQEKESGESLFPAGGDSQETLKDKLTALKEKAQLELDTKREYYGAQPAAAPPPTPPAGKAAPKVPMTIDAWMDANPQRAGESDKAYMTRARISREGK